MPIRFLSFTFAPSARASPTRLQYDPTPWAIVNLGKIPEIKVNPMSAQRQADGRRAGLKIRWCTALVRSVPHLRR